ncbi:MAG: type III restriction endonuclease subunit M [Fimbriimonadaceae bacterium]
MLNMVEQETFTIESRFLEPACGDGNFLDEVLRRKLSVVESRYKRSQLEWERYALLAITSLYGIDILPDNVQKCQVRLLERVETSYARLFKRKVKPGFLQAVKFVLSKNIIWGDAISLKKCDGSNSPVVFSQWSPVNGSLIKRKDFAFEELLPPEEGQINLFGATKRQHRSDTGQTVFFPDTVAEYPPVHFLRLCDE